MFSSLKQFLTRYRARRELRRKGVINSKPWFDLEQFGNALDRSSAPAVVMLVMVWAVSSVLLSMAAQKQLKDPGDWVVGQKATRTIHASRDFQYNDLEELAAKRREAAEEQPEFFRINTERSKQILNRIQELLQAAEQRLRMSVTAGNSRRKRIISRPDWRRKPLRNFWTSWRKSTRWNAKAATSNAPSPPCSPRG